MSLEQIALIAPADDNIEIIAAPKFTRGVIEFPH
ncbi:hypothetical protein Maes01_00064 [Microbulbifer aestuariivivens]|uniref:Uncharacterized protein n=1 Tax=Microbulbifer aestuariivivens TaxID=1908308 RepID=A0ABP9WJZ4_9GAMM